MNNIFQMLLGWHGLLLAVSLNAAPSMFDHPEAELIETVQERSNLRLIVGDVKKISAQWVSENEVKLFAEHQDSLYQLPKGTELEPVAQEWRTKLLTRPGKVLRECFGRACGNSNFYANAVFSQRTLYGRDDDQAYTLWMSSEKPELWMIYAVVRGNRQLQVIERLIRLNDDQLRQLKDRLGLNTEGAVAGNTQLIKGFKLNAVGQIDWLGSKASMASLTEWINKHSKVPAYLVIYRYAKEELVVLQQQATSYGQEFMLSLRKRQIPVEQLEMVGAGPLKVLPADEIWIEWIIKPNLRSHGSESAD